MVNDEDGNLTSAARQKWTDAAESLRDGIVAALKVSGKDAVDTRDLPAMVDAMWSAMQIAIDAKQLL